MEPLSLAMIMKAVGSLAGAAGTGMQAYGEWEEGKLEQQRARENARRARMEAADTVRRGAEAASRARMEGSRIIASQKTALGASGVDVGVGSAVSLMADSRMQSELDAVTLRNNAMREAYGMRMQATELETYGRRAKLASERRMAATILGGARELASGVMGGA